MNELEYVHACADQPGSIDEPSKCFMRVPLSSAEAAAHVFEKAFWLDFYAILVSRESEDEEGCKNYKPILHQSREFHDEVIASAGDRKTYWNLCSYRPTAIKRNGSFSWSKKFVRGLHGVFIDFDCGRMPGDDKCDEPGAMLTQDEVWKGVCQLVEQRVLPPFQMWADGTRGCYGVMLFEEPHPNIEEAAEMWRELRGYFYRRAKHLAADELARAITQPLKAPGACGLVRYYSTSAPRTSLAELLAWFRAHPHPTDLVDGATPTYPFTVEHQNRLCKALALGDNSGGAPKTPRSRAMTWQQKAAPMKARIDDFRRFVAATRCTGYSRRKFFLDLASAVKKYEFQREDGGDDVGRVYRVALEICEEVNALLDRPLSSKGLQVQVHAANPNIQRSSDSIRQDMGITESIAEELGLRTLIPPTLRVERFVREREEIAVRAEKRAIERKRKADENAARRQQRALVRDARQRAKEEARSKPKKNEIRDIRVEIMLREGVLSTTEIARAVGIHRQQIARIRKRMVSAGITLPKQPLLKRRGRGHGSQNGFVPTPPTRRPSM